MVLYYIYFKVMSCFAPYFGPSSGHNWIWGFFFIRGHPVV